MTTKRDITNDDVRQMATTLGLTITAEDLPEVTHRFTALLDQLQKLDDLDLDAADPTAIFPREVGV